HEGQGKVDTRDRVHGGSEADQRSDAALDAEGSVETAGEASEGGAVELGVDGDVAARSEVGARPVWSCAGAICCRGGEVRDDLGAGNVDHESSGRERVVERQPGVDALPFD